MKSLLFTMVAASGFAVGGWNKPTSCEEIKEEKKSEQKQGFYLKAGSGASFSREARISAPPAVWDPAFQGYNASLGTTPIALGGLGYDSPYVSADITASYRPDFSYNKFQMPTTTSTPGTIGTTTRRFDLDVSSMMFTVYLNGRGFDCARWNVYDTSSIYPVVGGGVGVSQMTIYNFRSTGLPPVADGFPGFASENQYSTSYRFTYQVMAGLEWRYKDLCALSAAYRWFDVSSFKGPRYLRNAEGQAVDVGGNTWRINFDANEAFIELKVFL